MICRTDSLRPIHKRNCFLDYGSAVLRIFQIPSAYSAPTRFHLIFLGSPSAGRLLGTLLHHVQSEPVSLVNSFAKIEYAHTQSAYKTSLYAIYSAPITSGRENVREEERPCNFRPQFLSSSHWVTRCSSFSASGHSSSCTGTITRPCSLHPGTRVRPSSFSNNPSVLIPCHTQR